MVDTGNMNWISNYIWGITDDVLRDLYVRGKYRDVILPMTVLRRLDAVLEDSKQSVLDMKKTLDDAGVVAQDSALRQAAGHAFLRSRCPPILPSASPHLFPGAIRDGLLQRGPERPRELHLGSSELLGHPKQTSTISVHLNRNSINEHQ